MHRRTAALRERGCIGGTGDVFDLFPFFSLLSSTILPLVQFPARTTLASYHCPYSTSSLIAPSGSHAIYVGLTRGWIALDFSACDVALRDARCFCATWGWKMYLAEGTENPFQRTYEVCGRGLACVVSVEHIVADGALFSDAGRAWIYSLLLEIQSAASLLQRRESLDILFFYLLEIFAHSLNVKRDRICSLATSNIWG